MVKTRINGATTMPHPLERDIETAGEAGFQGVEIRRDKLDRFLEAKPVEELNKLLSRHGLRAAATAS